MAAELKAIETQYKGYRFRSRLEARWAVFFDALGVKWEYEKEGYDLGEAGWYLPDFWLPEQKCFVEIKPLVEREEVRSFYLAGKITDDDWRGSILSEGQDILIGGDLYRGPHYVECHGSANGHDWLRGHVAIACREEIDRSDVLFAWVDEPHRYGTVAEIGYAVAKHIPVYLALGDSDTYVVSEDWDEETGTVKETRGELNADDYWFAAEMATKTGRFPSAKVAFETWFPRPAPTPDEQKCLAVSLHSPVFLVRGEPYAGTYQVAEFDSGVKTRKGATFGLWLSPHGAKLAALEAGYVYAATHKAIDAAYTAARSARFEHGEIPCI